VIGGILRQISEGPQKLETKRSAKITQDLFGDLSADELAVIAADETTRCWVTRYGSRKMRRLRKGKGNAGKE
jgi:hypothetical protein